MPGSAISFDQELLLDGIEQVKVSLDFAAHVVRAALSEALYEIAKDLTIAAQARLAPQNRSERLSQSAAVAEPEISASEIVVVAGFQEVYAAFRDHGGTIVPVRADVLTIPQKPILDSNGESIYANPRQEPKLFVIRWIGFDGKPRAGLAMKVDGRIEIHWIFAHSVTQDGSKYFTGTIQERQSQVGAMSAQLVKDELGRAA